MRPEADSDLASYWTSFVQNMHGPFPLMMAHFDKGLFRLVSNLNSPTNFESKRMIVLALGSLRAAAFLNLGGATFQCPPVVRQALECALYAHLFTRSERDLQDWRNRESSKSAKDRARKGMLGRSLIVIEQEDKETAKQAKWLHEELISFGAHPNVFAAYSSTAYPIAAGAQEPPSAQVFLLGTAEDRDVNSIWIGNCYSIALEISRLLWPVEFEALEVSKEQKLGGRAFAMFLQKRASARV